MGQKQIKDTKNIYSIAFPYWRGNFTSYCNCTFYLKELHTPTNSIHWLVGVIIAADHFGEILGLFIVPPMADKWGCIRLLMFLTNTAVITGNLIYSLHIHPFLLIAGRFLCGFGAISVISDWRNRSMLRSPKR